MTMSCRCDYYCLLYLRYNYTQPIKHIYTALQIAPAMFIADWAFNNALRHTSVASATVIVSSQNVVVFLLAVLLKIEAFGWIKLGGVLISMVGIALTAVHDTSDENMGEALSTDAIVGDLFALVAAVSYGLYTVQVRLFCPQNEDLYKMQVRDSFLISCFLSCVNIHFLLSLNTFISNLSCPQSVIDGIHRSSCSSPMSSICRIHDIQCSTRTYIDHFGMHCRQGVIRFCNDGLLPIPIGRVDFRYNRHGRVGFDYPHGICCRSYFPSSGCHIDLFGDWGSFGGCWIY